MSEQACTINDCEKQRRPHGSLCSMHQRRKDAHGDPLAQVRSYERQGTECSVDGCDRAPKAKGLCHAHYQRLQRGAPVHGVGLRQDLTSCTLDGCDRPHKARGLCNAHYLRQKQGKDLDAPVQEKSELPDGCGFDGCARPPRARGLCPGHYRQQMAGQPLAELIVSSPRGSGWVTKDGYKCFKRDGRTWFEHRWNAQLALGRDLLATEEIHHVNGNRLDNETAGPFRLDEAGRFRSGNLELWSTSQPKGQEIGPKLEWAREILALYGS